MKVGQKIVCVGDYSPFFRDYPDVKFPVRGEIYTIRDFDIQLGITGIRLVEIVNPKRMFSNGMKEAAFSVDDFRPIDESFGEQVAEKLEVFFVPLEAAYKEQNSGE